MFDRLGLGHLILNSIFVGILSSFILIESIKIILIKRRLDRLDRMLEKEEIDYSTYRRAKAEEREEAFRTSSILRTIG